MWRWGIYCGGQGDVYAAQFSARFCKEVSVPKVNGKHFKYTAAGKKKAKAHAKKKGKIVVYKKKKG